MRGQVSSRGADELLAGLGELDQWEDRSFPPRDRDRLLGEASQGAAELRVDEEEYCTDGAGRRRLGDLGDFQSLGVKKPGFVPVEQMLVLNPDVVKSH